MSSINKFSVPALCIACISSFASAADRPHDVPLEQYRLKDQERESDKDFQAKIENRQKASSQFTSVVPATDNNSVAAAREEDHDEIIRKIIHRIEDTKDQK